VNTSEHEWRAATCEGRRKANRCRVDLPRGAGLSHNGERARVARNTERAASVRLLIGVMVGSSLLLCDAALAQQALPSADNAQLAVAAAGETRCKQGKNADGSCISKAQAEQISALRKIADCMSQARINYNWCPSYTPSTDDDMLREKNWEIYGRGPTGVAPPPPRPAVRANRPPIR
jgi:hypothetical protein